MPAISSLLIGASVAVGAASAVSAANARKKQLSQTKKAAKEQEVKAKNALNLKGTKEQDTRIKLGTDGRKGGSTGSQDVTTNPRTTKTGVSKSGAFGGVSASKIGGL